MEKKKPEKGDTIRINGPPMSSFLHEEGKVVRIRKSDGAILWKPFLYGGKEEIWIDPRNVEVLPKLKWPTVWLVQSSDGLTIHPQWFKTEEGAKAVADNYSPGNNWVAVPYAPPPDTENEHE